MTQFVNIYKVELDADPYQSLLLDKVVYNTQEAFRDAMAIMEFRGIPKHSWVPPKMHLLDPLHPEPDFWLVGMGCGAFGVHPRALNTVYMFLEMAGEMLPLPYRGKTITVANVTKCIDCVDEEKSEWKTYPSGRRLLQKPFFRSEYMQASTLFKIPQATLGIYCWEESGDAESEFKACVEENKLTGLKFELVWSEQQ